MIEFVLKEYDNEDENGRYRLVYAYFGSAIYFSQVIEESFSIMLWAHSIATKRPKTNKEVNEIIKSIENSKRTMRMFLKEIQSIYNIPPEIIKELEWILVRRNYLVHKYFKINIQKAYSDLGRKEMLKYFCEYIVKVKKIDEEITKYYKRYMDAFGITESMTNKMLEEMKDAEFKRESEILTN